LKRLSVSIFVLLCLLGCRTRLTDVDRAIAAPTRSLSSGPLSATLAMPADDATRFDQSGQLLSISIDGQTMFESLEDPRHEMLAVNAEEFSPTSPPGFGEADTFLKIGVGVLSNPDDKPYHFDRRYACLIPPDWRVRVGTDRTEFVQRLRSGGFACEYSKSIRLDGKHMQIVVERSLTNTGERDLNTEHYAHHFLKLINRPAGAGDVIALSFDPAVSDAKLRGVIELIGRSLRFTGTPPANKAIYVRIDGERAESVELTWQDAPVGLRITSAPPADWWILFVLNGWLSPEPFTRIRLSPGETHRWATTYTFIKPNP
jgi:hypothetical protein